MPSRKSQGPAPWIGPYSAVTAPLTETPEIHPRLSLPLYKVEDHLFGIGRFPLVHPLGAALINHALCVTNDATGVARP